MISCTCRYCRARRTLRRRNPDDLEKLEKIAEARRIYLETRSLRKTAEEVGVSDFTIKQWVTDLTPQKYYRNPDESLRKLQRRAASGEDQEAYYRQLIRAGRPIPSVAKAHKKLIKAINNFPMARTHQLKQQYGYDRPVRTSMTKKPFLQRPEEAIEYILPRSQQDQENIDATLWGQTSITDLVDSLDQVIDRSNRLIEPGRPAGGGEIVVGLQAVYQGNFRNVAEAARALAKAAAEVRFAFDKDERNVVWVLATELIHNIFEQVTPLEPELNYLRSTINRITKSLEGRIVEFRTRTISKSRVSHILGEMSNLAGTVHTLNPAVSTRLWNLKRKFEYLIVPLLMLHKKMGLRRRLRRAK